MNRKGFSLVEIMVVVVVIGIIIAAAVPNALKAIENGKTKTCAANIRTLDTAIQMFYSETGGWPSPGSIGTTLDIYLPTGQKSADIDPCPYGTAYQIAATGDSIDKTTHFNANQFPNFHIGQQ